LELEPLKGLILGKGKSGRAAAELLGRLNISFSFFQDGQDYPDLRNFDFAVKSPGFPPEHPLVKKIKETPLPILGEVELAARFTCGRLVGITGTNGKSTTTAIVYNALKTLGYKTFIGGNFGIPASSFALQTDSSSTSVLELSSFQIEDLISARFEVGAILNITPDHLNRYPSLSHYAQAKLKLLHHSDFLVVNADDPILSTLRGDSLITFSAKGKPADFYLHSGHIISKRFGLKVKTENLPLKGLHNLENYLCSAAILSLLGLSAEEIERSLPSFTGLPHRTERVATVNGIEFVNDSKSTNVDSLKKALLSFENIVLIAGGSDKGLDFSPLLPIVKDRVKSIVAIGETAPLFEKLFKEVVSVKLAQDMEEAVELAFKLASAGDTVLLSPGCASFDMFKNYEERGELFKRAVLKLEEEFAKADVG